MIQPAFQIPHHVAIHIFVYAPPCRKLSLNIGAGGDGIPAKPEKEYNNCKAKPSSVNCVCVYNKCWWATVESPLFSYLKTLSKC